MLNSNPKPRLPEIYVRINPKKFHLLKFILEGYDHMALVSSLPDKDGVARIRYCPDFYPALIDLLGSISAQITR